MVTTSTMHALPITTPSVVRKARTLLARKASKATTIVSLRSMAIGAVPVSNYNKPAAKRPGGAGSAANHPGEAGGGWQLTRRFRMREPEGWRASLSRGALLDAPEAVVRALAVRVQLHSLAILLRGRSALPLALIEVPEPFVRIGVRRKIAARGDSGKVGLQQLLGFFQAVPRQDARHAPVKAQAAVGGLETRSRLDALFHPERVIALQVEIGGLEVGIRALRLGREHLAIFLFRIIDSLSMHPEPAAGRMTLDRIHGRQCFHLFLRLVLAAAHDARRTEVEFDQVLLRGEV